MNNIPLAAVILLQKLCTHKSIYKSIQINQEWTNQKDKRKTQHKRLKKCIQPTNSQMQQPRCRMWRGVFSHLVRAKMSFRRSAVWKNRAQIVGLLQVADTWFSRNHRDHLMSYQNHDWLGGMASLTNTICNYFFSICPESHVFSLKLPQKVLNPTDRSQFRGTMYYYSSWLPQENH